MEERMIFAGSGGQGLMLLGKLLAQAVMDEGRNVTWFPSYGAEVRGGTAYCHVVVSDEEIYSPLVEQTTAIVIMNAPSLKKFLPRLVPGGLLVLNTSLAQPPTGANGSIVAVPATDIGNEFGNIRVANMAMLGALNARRHIVRDDTVAAVLRMALGARKADLLDLNIAAYRKGYELGAN